MREIPKIYVPKKLQEENPCHNCTQRYSACHADCLKHKAWLDAVRDAKKQQFQQEQGHRLARTYAVENREKAISKMSSIRKSKFKT